MSSHYAPSESDDFTDYDVISDADPPSLGSSIADLHDSHSSLPVSPGGSVIPRPAVREILPSQDARVLYETPGMTSDDVQAHVQKSLRSSGPAATDTIRRSGSMVREKTTRVYVDGVFDVLHVGTMHRVRQAKLSFPSVYLLVGPFTDAQCRAHSLPCTLLHVERAEALRHVRWVDEIVSEAPVELSDAFLKQHRVDYVAIEEGSSVDPVISKAQLAGYDRVKGLGKAITTRRTRNVAAAALVLGPPAPETVAPTPAVVPRALEPAISPESAPRRAPEPEPAPSRVVPAHQSKPSSISDLQQTELLVPTRSEPDRDEGCPPYSPEQELATPEPKEDFLS